MSEFATNGAVAGSEVVAPFVPVYPVGLTLAGRQCLVVGGGRSGVVAAGARRFGMDAKGFEPLTNAV